MSKKLQTTRVKINQIKISESLEIQTVTQATCSTVCLCNMKTSYTGQYGRYSIIWPIQF